MGFKMNKMNDIEVIINNKRYNLCGYESEEYLQKIASYINSKYQEFKKQDIYRKMDPEMKNVLIDINIADDYFKIRAQVKDLEADIDEKTNEIYNLKHELIAGKTQLDSQTKEIEELKKELNDTQKKMIRLETELQDLLDHKQH